jgi:EmrB/QacA subfamily drug resistance transporter
VSSTNTGPAPSAGGSSDRGGGRRGGGGGDGGGQEAVTHAQWWALGLASVGSFMVILDMLVVATALTAIQRDLHASMADLEWTVNAYTLSFAVLLMTSASLGDRYGRRRLFVVGLALFALSSVGCALAPNVATLIAARAVQGVGAATIMPLALGLLNAAFPPARRGWAIGVYGGITAMAVMLGPVLGGVLTQGLAWQWIFWLNVPIGLAAIPIVLRHIPDDRAGAPGKNPAANGLTGSGPGGRRASVDVPGLLVFTPAAVGLVWGLVRADAAGWGSAEVIGALAAGAVLTVAFVASQARVRAPMLPLRLFRSRSFSAGNAVIFLLNASMTGAIFFMTQYQQIALGQGPLDAGLRMLPWGVAPVLIAPRAGALADRLGERPLIVLGMACQAVGMAWIALAATASTSYAALLAPMAIGGIGFALAIPAVTKAVVSTSAPADIGKASGAYSTMRQLGGAFGVAILSAVFSASGSYLSPSAFSHGVRPAMAASAGLALLGALAALVMDGRRPGRPGPGQARASTNSNSVADASSGETIDSPVRSNPMRR